MVLIAPSTRDLERLRILVQNQLAQRGLELSKKTEPLPPMTRVQVRRWLTDRRGGLGLSGPFAGPPVNWALANLDPLADAGDFDRSDALSLLHDPRLDNPATSPVEVRRAVEMAMTADDLRFGELTAAARLLWRVTLEEPDQPLCQAILGGRRNWTGAILPVPPGVGTPGLLAKTDENVIVRAEFHTVEQFCPSDLTWQVPTDTVASEKWKTWGSNLGDRVLLTPDSHVPNRNGVASRARADIPKWLATAY
jgi:hypothetical protein